MMQLYVPDPAPRHETTERELEVLWVHFTKLQRFRQEIMADFGLDTAPPVGCRGNARHEVTPPGTELDEAVFEPITSELRQLAYRAAKVTAKRPEDLEYKAVMLAEFLGPADDSLQTILATSLVMDIRHGRQRPPADHADVTFGHHAH